MTTTHEWLTVESESIYREQAKGRVTSHKLGDFRKSPLLYWRKEQGLIPEKDTPAYRVGRAAHKLILEGEQALAEAYAIGGPINPKTGEPYGPTSKAYQEWADAQGKPAITQAEYESLHPLSEAVRSHAAASVLLKEGAAEGVIRTEFLGEPVQARLDWMTPGGVVVELKTCDDLDYFEADCRKYGYAHQVAWYATLASELAGCLFDDCRFIAVEKSEPYRVGVWDLSRVALARASEENAEALKGLQNCRARGDWPTGYEQGRTLTPSKLGW